MPYDEGYEMSMKAVIPEDKLSLGQELQALHKHVSEHDEMMDVLLNKAEGILMPVPPTPVDDQARANRSSDSSLRAEIRLIAERMSAQNVRLRSFINRLDV